MKVEWDGRTFEYDDDHVTVREAMAIQAAYGFTLLAWNEALKVIDARAWVAAVWLMYQRNGVARTIAEVEAEDFDVIAFAEAVIDAKLADAKAATEGEPDPTSTRKGSNRPATGSKSMT